MGTFATPSIVAVALFYLISAGSVEAQRLQSPQNNGPIQRPTITLRDALLQSASPTIQLDRSPELRRGSALPGTTLQRQPKIVELPQNVAPGSIVGTTYYDFQTNGSMANRLGIAQDGGDTYLQVLWMAASDSTRDVPGRIPGFNTSRGSRYNYVNITDPANPEVYIENWQKAETDRAGWPSLVQFEDGSVGTPSHTPIRFYRNGSVGDQIFFPISEVATVADSAVWPRAALGDSGVVHVIYNRAFGSPGIDRRNEVVYRRSTNEGENFESEVFLTGSNSIYGNVQVGTGADSYTITARGSLVAVLFVDNSLSARVCISTDNGLSWPTNLTGYVATGDYNFIDSGFNADGQRQWYSDTVPTPNQHLDAVFDSNGTLHFVVGVSPTYVVRTEVDGVRSGLINVAPGSPLYQQYGLMYGNTRDSVLYFMGFPSGTGWDGNGTRVNDRGYDGTSRWPQLAIDNSNNLYCMYGSMKNGDVIRMIIDTTVRHTNEDLDTLSEVDGLVGHLWATQKLAGYPYWSEPKDLTPDGVPSQYPSVLETLHDNRIWFAYSTSDLPGDGATNIDRAAIAAVVRVHSIVPGDLNPVNSVDEGAEGATSRLKVTPNPVSDVVRIALDRPANGMARLTIIDALGQVVLSQNLDSGSVSESTIAVSPLPTGTYTVSIDADGNRTTTTMVVVR